MNQSNSGLLRFRSAPSSLFSNLPNDKGSGDSIEGFLNHRDSTSPELTSSDLISQRFGDFGGDNNDKGLSSKGSCLNSQLPPHYPRQSSKIGAAQMGAVDGTYTGGDNQGQTKMGLGLMRQSSSPAGLFSHLAAHNGYATMRGVGSYGASGDLSPSSNMLKRQMSFSSGVVPSSLGMLSRISEIEGENIDQGSPDDGKLGNGSGPTQFYSSDYPFGSWNNNSLHFAENFKVPTLSHHLSLPQTSAEMEKLLQFQDSVPCKIRAKRGCATHPRSIAERVRRTRISERMRKLQELVPYMDKQTNTADMLDLAVEYIKDLQKQFKTLSDSRANCKCSNIQKPVIN
ncbi:hypothetical protein LguiB_004415 [Lonicera macranthoides]